MTDTLELEAQWHNDNHWIALVIRSDRVGVTLEFCPNGEKEDAECWSAEADGCIVKWFVEMYGLDVNVGTVNAASTLKIAWSALRGADLTSSQVWIIPVDDEAFAGWIVEQMEPEDGTE